MTFCANVLKNKTVTVIFMYSVIFVHLRMTWLHPHEGLRSFWMALNSCITASVHTSLCCRSLMWPRIWAPCTRVSTVLSKSCWLRGRSPCRASPAIRRRMSESDLGRTSSQMTSSFCTLLRDASSSSGISMVWRSSSICIPASRIWEMVTHTHRVTTLTLKTQNVCT